MPTALSMAQASVVTWQGLAVLTAETWEGAPRHRHRRREGRGGASAS